MNVGPPPLNPITEMKAAVANMKQREADHIRSSDDEALRAAVINHERIVLENLIDAIEARAEKAKL